MPIEDTVNFLWSCAVALSPDNHAQKLLKSYYINKCRQMLPAEKFAASRICPHCSTFWSDGHFSLKLRPQRIVRSTKAQRLIAKLEDSKKSDKRLLTKKQRTRAKWLKKRVTSNVEISCKFCHHKTLLPLEKPAKRASSEVRQDKDSPKTDETAVPKPKKKKKKKDKTAGLKIPTAAEKQPNGAKQKIVSTSQSSRSKSAKAPSATPQSNAHLKQTPKSKKTKKKAPLIAPKIQSKTQKQNSLVQLAMMLKAQTSKSATNTAQKRLNALLK